jgi:hypothetical protein
MPWDPSYFVREPVGSSIFTSVCRLCGTIVAYHVSEAECTDHEKHHFCGAMELEQPL